MKTSFQTQQLAKERRQLARQNRMLQTGQLRSTQTQHDELKNWGPPAVDHRRTFGELLKEMEAMGYEVTSITMVSPPCQHFHKVSAKTSRRIDAALKRFS